MYMVAAQPRRGERHAPDRLRRRRCRVGGVRARVAPDRGPVQPRHRPGGRRGGHLGGDLHAGGLAHAVGHGGRLGLRDDAPSRELGAGAPVAAREGARRLQQPQRDGLHPGQPAGLRRLGLRRQHRLGLPDPPAGDEADGGRPRRGSALPRGRRAEREVILSAGAIDSPAILLRSGIGPASELAELGIDRAVDLPGVGRNLHDHLLMGVIWEAKQPVPPPEYNLAESSMFLRSDPSKFVPDLHFMFIHVPFHLPTYSVPEGAWTIAVGLVRPASRGTVRLRSAGLEDKPLIDPGYLTQPADVEAMVRGTKLARDLATATALDPWRGPEALPGAPVQQDAEIVDFVRHAAGTYYHPVGSWRMGVGPDAVVDPALRVRGVQGLRVADP